MRRPVRIIIAVVLLAVAMLALFARSHPLSIQPPVHTTAVEAGAQPALRHNPTAQASCAAGVTVSMSQYRPEGPNHLTVTIDGKSVADLSFGESFSAGYANPDPTKPHTWHVIVSSADGGVGNLDTGGTIEACVTASTVPPTTAAATTTAASTTQAATTSAQSTPAASTSAPATVPPTNPPTHTGTLPGTR